MKTKTKTAAAPAPKKRGRPPGSGKKAPRNIEMNVSLDGLQLKNTTPTPSTQPTPAQARPTIQLPLVLDVPVDLILAALGERLK